MRPASITTSIHPQGRGLKLQKIAELNRNCTSIPPLFADEGRDED